MLQTLHVCVVHTNPVGYASRVKLYKEFEAYISKFNRIQLHVVEGRYPGHAWQVTDATNPNHLQVELEHWMWTKEALLSMLFRKLPDDGQPVAWVDADVIFSRPDWVDETLRRLETHDILQLFGECQDLSQDYGLVSYTAMPSMVRAYVENRPRTGYSAGGYSLTSGHCGYAWAAKREFIQHMGNGLLDFAILGSADYIMATAFMGRVDESIPKGVGEGYIRAIREYAERVKEYSPKLGYVPGLLLHNWHGRKINRGYGWRNNILAQNGFDPHVDLAYREDGLIQLAHPEEPRHRLLQEQIRGYFFSRNEDEPFVP